MLNRDADENMRNISNPGVSDSLIFVILARQEESDWKKSFKDLLLSVLRLAVCDPEQSSKNRNVAFQSMLDTSISSKHVALISYNEGRPLINVLYTYSDTQEKQCMIMRKPARWLE